MNIPASLKPAAATPGLRGAGRRYRLALGLAADLVLATSVWAAEPNLVLGYGFERFAGAGQQAVDASASGLNGQLVGTPTLPVAAPSVAGHGQALDFDSARKQFVNAGDANALDVDRYTIAAWVRYRPNVHDERWEVLEKAGAYWMNIRTADRKLRAGGIYGACSGAGSKWVFVDTVSAIPATRWVHLASTYDGTTLRVYINGVLDVSKPVSGRTCANAQPLAIGAKYKPAEGVLEALFDGRIDDVRVYNRALSAAEIQTMRRQAVP
jgi:Concanavalin A-like lectin/glucanases superfamily